MRQELSDEDIHIALNHDDWLYDENGLPKRLPAGSPSLRSRKPTMKVRDTMTDTVQVKVDADGRVAIPGARPGQTVTLKIVDLTEPTDQSDNLGPIPDDEWAVIEARIKKLAQEIRKELPEPWLSSDHGDLLYGEDGLPK